MLTLLLLFYPLGLSSQVFETDEEVCARGKGLLKSALQAEQTTPEQAKMDVKYYRIELDVYPSSNHFTGQVTSRLEVTDASLQTIELDLYKYTYITVDSVVMNQNSVPFVYGDGQVSVALEDEVALGDSLEVTVYYTYGPVSKTDYRAFNFDTHNDPYTQKDQDLIWTMSQPFDARAWWPCKDYPIDKPDSVDIILTVPDHLIAVSNGALLSEVDDGAGRKTYHWHESYPIATYLVSLAIYPYHVWGDEYVSASNDTMPISFYTFTDPDSPEPSYLTLNYLKTKPMLYTFVKLFGEYPFLDEKYGHAEWGESFGMEHQTITSMGTPTERRVAHELAHQWWGDMITCATYQHMWLNEGFATYAEALWIEDQHGTAAYHAKMPDFAYYGPGSIYIPDLNGSNVLHYGLEYEKGAYVLHMLRHVVGDPAFFQILKTYADDPRYKYGGATTEQFRDVCEAVSGRDLDAFFQQWIYGQYYPFYSVSWRAEEDTLFVGVQQIQGTGLVFHMPVDLLIDCGNTSFIYIAENMLAQQEFAIPLPSGQTPQDVVLDPDNWILKAVTYLSAKPLLSAPTTFRLHPAYPNPFNATTTLAFDLPYPSPVNLTIYNLAGGSVWQYRALLQAGSHHVQWQGTDQVNRPLSSGIYIARLLSTQGAQTRKIILLK